MQATNLSSYLDDSDLEATVFVPTNTAFEAVLSQYGITTEQALSEPTLLKGVSPLIVLCCAALRCDML